MLLLIDGMRVNACVRVCACECLSICVRSGVQSCFCSAAQVLEGIVLDWADVHRKEPGVSMLRPEIQMQLHGWGPLPLPILSRNMKEGPGSEGKGHIGGGARIGKRVAEMLLTQSGGTRQKPGILPHTEDGDPRDREAIAQGKTLC